MAPQKLLLVGLPESGKTTFLAAFWHVVEGGELESALRLANYVGDYKYLNQIRSRWLSGQPVGRTQTGSAKPVTLRLTETESGTPLALDIPDMNGETFRDQWKNRSWTTDFDALAKDADGVLFFVHPGKIKESREIADIEFAVGSAAPTDVPEGPADEATTGETDSPDDATEDVGATWSPNEASTQVVTVELLQFLRRVVAPSRLLSVAVVVSAWDLVPLHPHTGAPSDPADWLRDRLPLLWQYLESNPERFRWTTFGVSAQGGDIGADGFSETIAESLDHAERIDVVSAGGHSTHDITAPVTWLLE